MINGLLKILYLFIILTLYHIKIVLSNVLDLRDIKNSEFHTLELLQQGIIKTMIYSTADKPITKICKGSRVIWQALPGESAKCITLIRSKWAPGNLMTIEINNPSKTDMLYIYKEYFHYYYTTEEGFKTRFLALSKPQPTKYIKRDIPKKRKAETDDTGEPEKKIPSQPAQQQPQPQQIEPEVVQVEVESDDTELTDKHLRKEHLRQKIRAKIQKKKELKMMIIEKIKKIYRIRYNNLVLKLNSKNQNIKRLNILQQSIYYQVKGNRRNLLI
ncbi:TpHN family protein [Theileria parva strain Muguga]|uniref:Tash1 protein, putative n=1 Tax=Theileria parva TaxID=5875 RepID=Q4N861_THEPA|nr:uncharacterized protein TpMuguga_01g00609 [Theileria parva strain Muguga]EAN33847.1 TpHN family protein [Theileria parva strain Muguga]|eukprot:XP_766130.1 hypothetical protein [Theileria parva strain Muguga]